MANKEKTTTLGWVSLVGKEGKLPKCVGFNPFECPCFLRVAFAGYKGSQQESQHSGSPNLTNTHFETPPLNQASASSCGSSRDCQGQKRRTAGFADFQAGWVDCKMGSPRFWVVLRELQGKASTNLDKVPQLRNLHPPIHGQIWQSSNDGDKKQHCIANRCQPYPIHPLQRGSNRPQHSHNHQRKFTKKFRRAGINCG